MNAWMILIASVLLVIAGAAVFVLAGLAVLLLRAVCRPSSRPPGSPPTYFSDWDDDDEIAARHHLHDL